MSGNLLVTIVVVEFRATRTRGCTRRITECNIIVERFKG